MLKVDALNQYYGGSHILRTLGFEAQVGEVTVVLGRNGVGKTTLLKSLMGLTPVKSGTISLDGCDITRAASYDRVRTGVGYVPQGREIFGRLTVEDNLRMGLASKPGATPIPNELFDLFPVLKQMIRRPRRSLRRPATATRDCAGARCIAQTAAARRAHRGHPAEHHQGDRPRHPPARRSQDDGDRAGRAVLRLRRRACRPVPGDGARRDRHARSRPGDGC